MLQAQASSQLSGFFKARKFKKEEAAPSLPDYRCSLPGLAGLAVHCRATSWRRGGIRTLGGLPHTRFPIVHSALSVTSPVKHPFGAMEEKVGFEPTVGFPTSHFECDAFDLSAISP